MGEFVDTPSTPSADIEGLAALLRHDTRVKVAGIDTDGILRGKVMAKDKFLSSAVKGFGMSSAIFGWDMHDVLYTTHTEIMSAEGGLSADFIAIPDLKSFRRIPWEDGIPFFLLRYVSSDDRPVFADGRSMIRDICAQLESFGYAANVGSQSCPSDSVQSLSTDHSPSGTGVPQLPDPVRRWLQQQRADPGPGWISGQEWPKEPKAVDRGHVWLQYLPPGHESTVLLRYI